MEKRVRGLGALAIAAAGLALLLVATAPERALPAELAGQPLRLPEPQELDLPDPSYQSGFPEVCRQWYGWKCAPERPVRETCSRKTRTACPPPVVPCRFSILARPSVRS